MIIFGRVVAGFNRLSFKMSKGKAGDLSLLEDHATNGENMISFLKEEIKQLMSVTLQKKERTKVIKLQEENKKLQNEINMIKKELVKLQVANGVLQVPVPDDEPEGKARSLKLYSDEVSQTSSDLSENLSSQPTSQENASQSNKTSKPKKAGAAGAAVPEAPVDVGRLDIRVGKVLHAQIHPDADQLYIEQIDVGEDVSRTIVSGLVRHIPLGELDQRMVVVLCNLKPQKMRGIVSEGMVLCASTPETVELLTPPAHAKAGDNITVPGYPRNPDLPFMNPKKKIFERVAEDLQVNGKKQASYKDIPWEVENKGGFVTVQILSGCQIR